MSHSGDSKVSAVLQAAQAGDRQAVADLLPLVYAELHELATARLARQPPGQTLTPTALVNEVYLRIAGDDHVTWEGRQHFLFAAAPPCATSWSNRRRRPGQTVAEASSAGRLDEACAVLEPPSDDVLAVHEALEELEVRDPLKADRFARYFTGLTREETATVLGLAERHPRPALALHPGVAQAAPELDGERKGHARVIARSRGGLFLQATDIDPADRGAFLDEQCAGDPDLRTAVEDLLRFDAEAESDPDFLPSPAADGGRTAAKVGAWAPTFIGRYRILRLHGEGGMGTVYEAEQDNPRRTVALKVIRPGLVSTELLNRFSHEAQILGRLQHSGIAQVYEAGSAQDGQPFFAMEFIRGMPLDEYARIRRLAPAARLELMARVCDAVQHAHDKGVIHRDLKPANILVD